LTRAYEAGEAIVSAARFGATLHAVPGRAGARRVERYGCFKPFGKRRQRFGEKTQNTENTGTFTVAWSMNPGERGFAALWSA
jgi:hypothetical protein